MAFFGTVSGGEEVEELSALLVEVKVLQVPKLVGTDLTGLLAERESLDRVLLELLFEILGTDSQKSQWRRYLLPL